MQLSKSRVFHVKVRPRWGETGKSFYGPCRDRKLDDARVCEAGKSGKMEASGFEPLTYCVQSSRSTN